MYTCVYVYTHIPARTHIESKKYRSLFFRIREMNKYDNVDFKKLTECCQLPAASCQLCIKGISAFLLLIPFQRQPPCFSKHPLPDALPNSLASCFRRCFVSWQHATVDSRLDEHLRILTLSTFSTHRPFHPNQFISFLFFFLLS